MDDLPSVPSDRSDLSAKTKIFEIDNNVAAMLSYVPFCLVNVIASVVFLASEPKSNRFLRYHAIQSLGLNVGYLAVGILCAVSSFIFSVIPFLGFLAVVTSLIWGLATLIYVVGNLYMMYAAYKGKMISIPVISQFADQNL